jgi:16S rRNA (adenine(1408)-N(1))-methyltransferase
VRVLEGTRVAEVTRERIDALLAGRRVVVDVGTGDGRFVYETARRDKDALYVGIDPDAGAMAEYAYRAARKPARGGIENALYVVAALEQLPPELAGAADVVHVNFPWAGLLRAVIRPEPEALAGLVRLLRPGGQIEIVLCYDAQHDKAALRGETLPPLDGQYIEDVMRPAYAAAGLAIEESRQLSREEALAIASTWGRRLLHGRPRDVFWVKATIA